jgi:hypothetical protein
LLFVCIIAHPFDHLRIDQLQNLVRNTRRNIYKNWDDALYSDQLRLCTETSNINFLLFDTTISIPGSVRNNSAPSSFSNNSNDRESHQAF